MKSKKGKQKKIPALIKIILWLLPVIIVGIIGMGFLPVSNAHLIKKSESLLRHAALDSCTIGKVSLTFYRGLVIKDLSIWEKIDSRRALHVIVPEVKIDYHFFRVIHRWKKSKASLRNRFSVNAYKVNKKRKSTGRENLNVLPALYSNLFKSNLLLLSCIKTVTLKNARVSVDSLGRRTLGVSGLDCKVQVDKSDSSRLKIKLSADTLRNNGLEAFQVLMSMSVNGPQCIVSKIKCKIFNGKMNGTVNLDLEKNRINSGNIRLKNIYLEKIYTSRRGDKGSMSGMCDFSMVFGPGVAKLSSLQGRGAFKMSNVSMNKLAALKKFVRLTDLTSLFHLTFNKLRGDFIIKDNKVTSNIVEGDGKPISVKASGWFRRDNGEYNYEVKGIFDPEYKDSISHIVWNALVPEGKGRRSFYCTVYGDDKSLSISLEKRVMRRAINNAFKDFGDELGDIFKR